MLSQPLSLAFSLGAYSLRCVLEESLLKLAVTVETGAHQLALTQLNQKERTIDLTLTLLLTPSRASSNVGIVQQEQKMQERMMVLESYVSELQKLAEVGSKSGQHLNIRGWLRSSEQAKEMTAKQLEGRAIHKEMQENLKLELLNDLLQEKIMKREGELVELERTLSEREELIRQLADKLILANIEKQDIFNEYQKILQNTLFHQEEASPKSQSELGKGQESTMIQVREGEGQEGE